MVLTMFFHYLKIAIRNIRKYAFQNFICIMGLAVGFLAISLSAYWYWFDNNYDKQFNDWDRIYTIQGSLVMNGLYTPISDQAYDIISHDPAVERVANIYPMIGSSMDCDETFFRMFGIELVEGSMIFYENYNYCAISESGARKAFGNENPIGQRLTNAQYNILTGSGLQEGEGRVTGIRVGGVYKDFNHSFLKSMKSDMIRRHFGGSGSDGYDRMVFIKVRPGTDLEALKARLVDAVYPTGSVLTRSIELINISRLHEKVIKGPMDIKHIRIFMLTSLLLILCAVTNSITMTVSRITGRRKEMGLRRSCGSSTRKLVVMLTVELAIQFLLSLLLALVATVLIKDIFSDYALIGGMARRIVYGCVSVMGAVFVIAMIAGVISMTYILKGSLNSVMTTGKSRTRRFRMTGLTIQLTISLACIFSCAVIVNQLAYTRNSYWGISTKGIVNIETQSDYNVVWSRTYDKGPDFDRSEIRQEVARSRAQFLTSLNQKLSSLPMVEYSKPSGYSFVEQGKTTMRYFVKTSLQDDAAEIEVREVMLPDKANSVYGYTVVEGSMADSLAADEIVLTRAVCRALGLNSPLGSVVYASGEPKTVVAVLDDIYLDGPLADPVPLVLGNFSSWGQARRIGDVYNVSVKINPSMRKEFSAALDEIIQDAPVPVFVTYMDDWLADFIKPANNLLRLMVLMSIVCMLIAVSGIYMVITLSCQERRREIAIRKAHGAMVGDIASILLKEYGIALGISAVIAFSVGSVLMHLWVQQFSKIAPMSWWLYASVLCGMILLILLTVGHRVLITSRQNPAEVIKSE